MRYTLLVALLLSLSVAGFSQSPTTTSIPSITQIIGWVGLSPSDFDSKVRDFGFTAEGNYVKDYGKDYVYVRKSVEGEIVLTERIILHIFSSNGGQQIQFVTAGPDLIKLYKPQLVQKGFKPTTCLLGDAENEMNFCYVSSSYRAILTDTRTQLSLGEGNTYSLVLKQLK